MEAEPTCGYVFGYLYPFLILACIDAVPVLWRYRHMSFDIYCNVDDHGICEERFNSTLRNARAAGHITVCVVFPTHRTYLAPRSSLDSHLSSQDAGQHAAVKIDYPNKTS